MKTLIQLRILVSTLALFTCAAVFGQATPTNAPTHVYRDQVVPHWFSGANGETNQFWYRVNLPADRFEFIAVNATDGKRAPAFDHARLAKALSEKTSRTIEPQKLPFDAIRFLNDGKALRLMATNAAWQCDLETYAVTDSSPENIDRSGDPTGFRGRGRRGGAGGQRGAPPVATRAGRSPDGNWEAVVRGHNLALRDVKTEKESQLTWDANPNNTYARSAEADRGVEMNFNTPDPEAPTPEVYWSPDSKHLVAMRLQPGTQRRVYLIESSPEDQLQPKLDSYPYLKPGDQVPIRKPHLFDVETKKEIPVDDALFSNPWSVGELRWATNSLRFTFLYNQRGHQVLRIVAVDAQSGAAKTIVDEQSKTFISYSGKFYDEYLDDTDEIVWMSERDGWNHLYLYDAKTGAVKNQITKGEWVVRGVDNVDKVKRQIWFRAGGLRPPEDPYYIQYCRVNFDGTVNPLNAPKLDAIVATNGWFNFQVSGDFGPDYSIQASTNLLNWATIFTTNSPLLPFNWIDPQSGLWPAQFYRVLLGT